MNGNVVYTCMRWRTSYKYTPHSPSGKELPALKEGRMCEER